MRGLPCAAHFGPPPTEQEPEPPPLWPALRDVELVTVAEIRDSFALNLAKASLEDGGIAYIVGGERAAPVLREYRKVPSNAPGRM